MLAVSLTAWLGFHLSWLARRVHGSHDLIPACSYLQGERADTDEVAQEACTEVYASPPSPIFSRFLCFPLSSIITLSCLINISTVTELPRTMPTRVHWTCLRLLPILTTLYSEDTRF